MAHRTLSREELERVLADHLEWCRGEDGGTRADLTDADLTDADLTDADLTGVMQNATTAQ